MGYIRAHARIVADSVCGHVMVSATAQLSASVHPRFRMRRFRVAEVTAR